MWLVTASGLDAHDYGGLVFKPDRQPGQAKSQASLNGAWDETIKQVLKPLQPGLTSLALAGAHLPEIGMELADEKGKVVADGELAWTEAKLVILRDDQADLAEAWQSQGWTALLLEASLADIGGIEWPSVVASHLGLTLHNKE